MDCVYSLGALELRCQGRWRIEGGNWDQLRALGDLGSRRMLDQLGHWYTLDGGHDLGQREDLRGGVAGGNHGARRVKL